MMGTSMPFAVLRFQRLRSQTGRTWRGKNWGCSHSFEGGSRGSGALVPYEGMHQPLSFQQTPQLTRRGNIHCEIANVPHFPVAPTEAVSIDFRDSADVNLGRVHGDGFFCPRTHPSQPGRQLCKLVSRRLLPRSRLSSGIAHPERARGIFDDDGRRHDAVRPRLKMAAAVSRQPMACLLRRGRPPGGPLRFRAAERMSNGSPATTLHPSSSSAPPVTWIERCVMRLLKHQL
jgi:hypothetical protein